MLYFTISPKCLSTGNQTLFLYMDAGGVVSANTQPQNWQISFIPSLGQSVIINQKHNMMLAIGSFDGRVGRLQGVSLNLGNLPPHEGLWRFGTEAIQRGENTSWNLNVLGSSYPDGSLVGVYHGWNNDTNESWVCTPVIA